jgi:hypothetical protein
MAQPARSLRHEIDLQESPRRPQDRVSRTGRVIPFSKSALLHPQAVDALLLAAQRPDEQAHE